MNILCLHNYYQQSGGEDRVFAAEMALLKAHGHRVVCYTKHNDQVATMGPLGLARATLWNNVVYQELRSLIRQEQPQIAHFHNTFPLISPAAYYAAKEEGIPVIQTLHNYRLLCLNALFFRNGHVCEECRPRVVPWPGVLHACYRGHRALSSGVAAMLVLHRLLRTWTNAVDTFISLTEFARHTLIAGRLPADKIQVKPNFVYPVPSIGQEKDRFVLFVGRLSAEKGIETLLRAWGQVRSIPLWIIGDGPLMATVQQLARQQRLDAVRILGRQARDDTLDLVKRAQFLVFTSECYESLPTVIMESFACGTPVLASRIGAANEMVTDGRTGVQFSAGSPVDLAEKVGWCWDHPTAMAQMGRQARQEFEQKYTAEQNYRALMRIYGAPEQD